MNLAGVERVFELEDQLERDAAQGRRRSSARAEELQARDRAARGGPALGQGRDRPLRGAGHRAGARDVRALARRLERARRERRARPRASSRRGRAAAVAAGHRGRRPPPAAVLADRRPLAHAVVGPARRSAAVGRRRLGRAPSVPVVAVPRRSPPSRAARRCRRAVPLAARAGGGLVDGLVRPRARRSGDPTDRPAAARPAPPRRTSSARRRRRTRSMTRFGTHVAGPPDRERRPPWRPAPPRTPPTPGLRMRKTSRRPRRVRPLPWPSCQPPTDRPVVLFVEDERSILEPFSRALAREGFDPVPARTVAEALARGARARRRTSSCST